MADRDYTAETKKLEERAEEHAPGVLELLEIYGRSIETTAWQAVNQGVIRQASGTSPPPATHT